MGLRSYKDFDAWRLARELEVRIAGFITSGPATRDHDFCDDIRRSSRSAPRNIAEGFGRFYPADFARFVRNAIGSLHETDDHLDKGLQCGYLSTQDHAELKRLASRAIGASVNLARYLSSDAARRQFQRATGSRARNTRKREPGSHEP